MSDLGDIKEDVDLLRAKVRALTKIHILAIPLVVSPIV